MKQIEFYNFCYLFYILDYFTEIEKINFSILSSFDCILKFDENKSLIYSKTDYQKYYKGTISCHKRIKNLYDKISNELQINIDRLKPIQ